MNKILTTFLFHFCTGGLAFGVFGRFVQSLSLPMMLVYIMAYTIISGFLFLGFKRLTEGKQSSGSPDRVNRRSGMI